MVEINLLPWRAYQREYEKFQLCRYAIMYFVVLIIVYVLISTSLKILLQSHQNQMTDLQQQLSLKQKQSALTLSEEDMVLMRVISSFSHNQHQLAHFFDLLFKLTPEEVTWKNMLSNEDEVYLTGKITSFPVLLDFIKSFDSVKNTFHTEIVKIKSVPHSDMLEFSLHFYQVVMPLKSAEKSYAQ